jgi:hypothetical protein
MSSLKIVGQVLAQGFQGRVPFPSGNRTSATRTFAPPRSTANRAALLQAL